MTNLVPFSFDNQPVRVIDREGQPWFVLADLCRILDLSNPTKAAANLDEDEKHTLTNAEGIAPANVQALAIVNESGMWKMVLRSRKPAAARLTKWITSQVLPSIRRTGSYGMSAPALDLRDPVVLHRLLLDHTRNAMAADARVAALEPKAEAFERLADAQGSLCITDAAKAMGVQPRRLFSWLEANHWTYRRGDGGAWVAYQTKIDGRWLEHKAKRLPRPGQADRLVEQVMVTPKGLARLTALRAGA